LKCPGTYLQRKKSGLSTTALVSLLQKRVGLYRKRVALHRSAPIGTVMKITNPMSNRTTFAKVVGKFTENESTKDIIIVMTKAVADALGALDKRFYCNLTYGGQDNEQK